jgi:hypothetical protein
MRRRKKEKVVDGKGNGYGLTLTRDQAGSKKMTVVRVGCGCCSRALTICHDPVSSGDIHVDELEIGGVLGTLDQWRKVLVPLLQLETGSPAQSAGLH